MNTPLNWVAPFVEEMAAEGCVSNVLVYVTHCQTGSTGTAVLSALDTPPLIHAKLENLKLSLREAIAERRT